MIRRLRFYWRHRCYWRVVLNDSIDRAVDRYRAWLFPPSGGPPFAF